MTLTTPSTITSGNYYHKEITALKAGRYGIKPHQACCGAADFPRTEQGSPKLVAGLAVTTALDLAVRVGRDRKDRLLESLSQDYMCLFPSEEEASRATPQRSFPSVVDRDRSRGL